LRWSGLRRARAAAGFAREAAAVLGQKADQAVHALKVRAVVEIASVAPALHETGLYQALEVKGQSGRRKTEATGELGGGVPLGTSFHQQSEDRETSLRRKSAQGRNGFLTFHRFNYMELIRELQWTLLIRKVGELAKFASEVSCEFGQILAEDLPDTLLRPVGRFMLPASLKPAEHSEEVGRRQC
jgi:hypothetical protein